MPDDDPKLERMRRFVEMVPFNRALGLQLESLGPGTARFRLPYRESLVGNPDSGILHGGAITSLLDACCGAAVFMKLAVPTPIATLELRIDYLGPAAAGHDVTGEATCIKVTRHIAFVRGAAFDAPGGEPVATATGTFMLTFASARRAT